MGRESWYRITMASHALVLTGDPHSSILLRQVLEEFHLKADLCLNARSAKRMLKQRRYESIFVDCESVSDSLAVIEDARADRENRSAITITLLRDAAQMRAAAEVGSTFVLHKPIPAEDARRIVRISRNLLARDAVRQFLRLPLPQLAYALLNDAHQIVVENVSEGGMAIQAEEQLAKGSTCRVRFTLPNENGTGTGEISADAEVVWADAAGRAGLKFIAMSEAHRTRLSQWIDLAYAAGMPDIDGNRRVVLDVPARIQYSLPFQGRYARLVAAATIDVGVAAAATALFMFLVWFFAGYVLPAPQALLTGALFCAAYHYLFVAHRKDTFGAHLARKRS